MDNANMEMETVYEKAIENGLRVVVLKNHTGGKYNGHFHAVLIDSDAEKAAGVVICPTLEMAMKHAAKWSA